MNRYEEDELPKSKTYRLPTRQDELPKSKTYRLPTRQGGMIAVVAILSAVADFLFGRFS